MSDWTVPSNASPHSASHAPLQDEDLLDEIVADCIESGDQSLSTRISKACDSHPRLASAIRRRFESLREVGLLREGSSADERLPERLGHFRLLERLGGGGMGVVFRARQESLGRDVALKLIRPEHLYFDKARERFRRETEAVARLQHPHIVPIYEVGEENGVPYFAMELVHGATLAAALEQLRTSAPERLSGADLRRALVAATPSWAHKSTAATPLFEGTYEQAVVGLVVQVADALEHAHSRSVLHRDLKPSNIAATPDGRALLFDFGLAGFDQETARLTATRTEIGSLPYMAPEHLRGGSRAATTRADVYALGVTLYELLALQLPYGDDDALETRRAILEGRRDPLRARNRAVSRDLELVCSKAMELDASRRYASAAEFAEDLRNVLEHRPIRARAPDALVVASRWIRRHPAKSTAIAASLCFAIGLPIALLVQESAYAGELANSLADAEAQRELALSARAEADEQRNRAREEAREALVARDFLVKLFGDSDPAFSGGRELSARDLLDIGSQRLESALPDQPLTRATLYRSIGNSYASLGAWRGAEATLLRALELSEKHAGPESLDVATTLAALASLEHQMGRPEALAHAERAVELMQAHTLEPNVAVADALIVYGLTLADAGRLDEADRAYNSALENIDQAAPDELSLRACVLVNYALLESKRGHHAEALRWGRDALATQREFSPAPHPAITSSLNVIAASLCALGELDESRAAFEELLELEPRVAGETLRYAAFLVSSTQLERIEGRLEAEIETLERAVQVYERVAPPTNEMALGARDWLVDAYLRAQRWSAALELQERLLDTRLSRDGPANELVLRGYARCAVVCSFLGDTSGANVAAAKALELAGELGPRSEPRWQAVAVALQARSALTRNELGLARELVALARERIADTPQGTPSWLWTTLASGELAQAEGDLERARSEFSGVLAFNSGPPLAAVVPALARWHLAQLLADTDSERALRLGKQALAELTQIVGAEHPGTRAAQAWLDSR